MNRGWQNRQHTNPEKAIPSAETRFGSNLFGLGRAHEAGSCRTEFEIGPDLRDTAGGATCSGLATFQPKVAALSPQF